MILSETENNEKKRRENERRKISGEKETWEGVKKITPLGQATEKREIDSAQEGGKILLPNGMNIVQMHRVV